MLRNRTTGVTVIGSNSFMISKDSIQVRESLGVLSLNQKATSLPPATDSKSSFISQSRLTVAQQSSTTTSLIENQAPPKSLGNDDGMIITEQPLVNDITDIPQDYPVDLNGFLNGLSEGLSNIVRDVKTSRFAADVKMDATSIWKSTKGAVARLVIEPLRSVDGEDFEDDEEARSRRRKKDYERTEAATKVRMPSAWGESSSFNKNSEESSSTSTNDHGRRRRSGEMGAKKLEKTPQKAKMEPSMVDDNGGGSETRQAEVGASIDLRKLGKARKVQVFHGPGAAIMVVGARRLVVLEARPTPTSPHLGVVVWMSSLENVASIALEIQPSSSNEELSVALKVEVKQGEDHVFLMGAKDSTALVQSIYARLNGEQPPPLPKPQQPAVGNDEKANEAACLTACSRASEGGTGDSDRMKPPKTPSGHRTKSDKHMKSSSKKRHHRSSHKKRSDRQENYNTQFPCSSGKGGNEGPPISPDIKNDPISSSSTFVSPSASKGNAMLSPLRIMLSPTGRGKDMSLEITSISSPRGTLSLGPPSKHVSDPPSFSPLKSKAICFDQADSMDHQSSTTMMKTVVEVEDGKTKEKEEDKAIEDPLPIKFKLMLKNGVPEQAVKNKMKSELNLSDIEVDNMLFAHSKALESQPSKSSGTIKGVETNVTVDSGLSANDAAAVSKYKMMLKAGVPEVGVIDKMKKDTIEDRLIEAVCPSYVETNNESKKDKLLNPEEDKQTRKYRAMLKAGVPSDAVRHKMVKDGLEKRLIQHVLGEDEKEAKDDNDVEVLTEEEEKVVAKFKAMLKAGVPPMAVKHKMIKELGKDNQRLIDAVCGRDKIETGGSEKWKGREDDDLDVLKTCQKSKNTSKLLTLHWTPLGISEEQLESSVWALARQGGDGLVKGSQDDGKRHGNTIVLSPEMQKLELLFSKKPAKSMQTPSNDMNTTNITNKKKKKASCLDNTRRQNLAIGLRSFKNISPISIGQSVASLDVEKFSAEQLTRLEEMLPAEAEIKSVENHVKDTEKDIKKSFKKQNKSEQVEIINFNEKAVELLEPAEAFVIGFTKIERAKPKLAILTLMRSLEPQVKELLSNFNTLGAACSEASSSPRLTSLLLEILAVGNIMNEGTEKGGAKGITVDSLLKLTNTRSVCKSMTVLDYIVDSLLVKQSKFTAEKVLSIEDMLDGTPVKKGLQGAEEDMEDGPASVLTFIKELPNLEDACRLPLGELMQQVTQISKALGLAKREQEKLRAIEEKKTNNKPTSTNLRNSVSSSSSSGVESDQGPTLKTNSLMEMLKKRAGERDEVSREERQERQQDREEVEGETRRGEEAIPIGRNLAESLRDEAEACQSTKEVSDANGLRASAFLATDPKAGLQAALKARAATEEEKNTTNNHQPITEEDSTTSRALKALDEFIGCAENCLKEVEDASNDCRLKTENMTKFFGEPGTDAGHILGCLKQFSAMTIDSKDKAIQKKIEEERRKRIAAKDSSFSSTPFKETNSSDHQRDIDPKAGLMSEIRKSKDARLERSLRATS